MGDAKATERDLAVWGAYADSALKLPLMQDNPAVRDALLKARTALSEGKTTGLTKAVKDALKACVPNPEDHPVRQGEVRRAAVNLEAILADLGEGSESGPVGVPNPEPTGDGKVDCSCGKRHAAGSKVLAKHQAAATN